jgi:hypothetical protein
MGLAEGRRRATQLVVRAPASLQALYVWSKPAAAAAASLLMLTTDCELLCLPLPAAAATPSPTRSTARSLPTQTPPRSSRGVKRPAHTVESDGGDARGGDGDVLVIPSTPPTPKLTSSPPLVAQPAHVEAQAVEQPQHPSLLHLPLHVWCPSAADRTAEGAMTAVVPRVVTAAVAGAACAAARTTTTAAATVVGGGSRQAVVLSRRGLPAVLLNLTGWNRSERICAPPDIHAAAAPAASSTAVAHEACQARPAAGFGKAAGANAAVGSMHTHGLQPTCALLLCRVAAHSARSEADHDEEEHEEAVVAGELASVALLRALLADPQMAAVAAAVVVEGDDDGGVRASPWLPPLCSGTIARCPDALPTLVLDLTQPVVALFAVCTDKRQATSALVVVGVGGRVVALCPQEDVHVQQRQHQPTREWHVHEPVSDACVVGGCWLAYVAGGVAYWCSLFDSEGEDGVRPLAAALQPTMIGTGAHRMLFRCFRRTARGRSQLHFLALVFPKRNE